MRKPGLELILDYILNKANEHEFEVIIKACEKRRKDSGIFASLGDLSPASLAGRIAESVEEGINESMDGLRQTVSDYIARIVRSHDPSISDAELEKMLEHCLPDRKAVNKASFNKMNEIPPQAVLEMIQAFMDYSNGIMPPSKQQELWENIPRWQDSYWKIFSPELKAFIKANLEGRLPDEEFWTAVISMLGL
jgi:hypothetical protein